MKIHNIINESQIASEHVKGGLDSYYQLTKAKRLAKADGHDYDKLPEYHRGADQPHKEKYMALAKEVKEAKGLGKRVKVVKGHFAGEEGTIREIKHGAFKGAPKSYYIDLDNGEMADNLPADVLRLIKRVEEVTIEQDQAESFDPAMEPNHSDTEFERIYSAYENGGEPELAEYLGMSESELDQEMTEYAMDHRLHMDDDRDTVIQGYIEQLIDNAEYKDMGAQMAQYEAKDITDLKRRAGII